MQIAVTSACCLLVHPRLDLILGVSRKDDHTQFGLPGGKLEWGENPKQAALRELQEETGLIGLDPTFLMERFNKDNLDACYLITVVGGEPRTTEKGLVRWVSREMLEDGPFGLYNRTLFQYLGGPFTLPEYRMVTGVAGILFAGL